MIQTYGRDNGGLDGRKNSTNHQGRKEDPFDFVEQSIKNIAHKS